MYRVRKEHCFGLLKQHFGTLRKLRMRLINAESSAYACKWNTTCCILHNFAIECKEDITEFDYYELNAEQCGRPEGIPQNENAPENIADELKRKALYDLIINSL